MKTLARSLASILAARTEFLVACRSDLTNGSGGGPNGAALQYGTVLGTKYLVRVRDAL